ncbi:MAG: DUF2341 domain-containing protein [Thermofilaceae archaeon]
MAVTGALIIIAVFVVSLVSLLAVFSEYNRFSQDVKRANEQVVIKETERLRVSQIDQNTIEIENQGSSPAVVTALFKVNPADKNPVYIKLPDPIIVPPLTIKQVSLAQPIPLDWQVGVQTSSGNLFWERQPEEGGGEASAPVPPGEPVYVTFDAEGLGSDAYNSEILRVDGVTYTLSSLPKTFRWISGETHSFEWLTPVYGQGTQYNWTSTRGLSTQRSDSSFFVDRNGYIIATYTVKYNLTISAQPPGGGSTTPPPGTYFYDPGSSVSISASPASGWAFERWVGSGPGSYTGSESSKIITINGPITQTAYFYTFSVSVSPSSGSVTAGGSVSATVTVSLTGGYSSSITVSLSASGLPSGASASFSPSSVTVSPSSRTATSTMTITTSSSTPTGTYSITITGSGGGLTKTAPYTLTVTLLTYTVSFQILDDVGNAVSSATLVFDGVSYSHGGSVSKPAGSYSLSTGTIPSGYRFSQWEASGGVSISNPSSSSTTATVSGSGTITMRLVKWLTGWSYRRPVTISHSGTRTLNQFPVLVTVDTASLISAGKMRSDGGDIRFTDSDGATLLPYWVESGLNTANTRIWVHVPSVPSSSNKTIYMYYGNPSATSQSSSSAVFGFDISSRFTSADYDNYYDAFILSSRQWFGGGTNIGLYGKDVATTLSLPFNAYIYAQGTTSIGVSTNGLIRWDGVADTRYDNSLDISKKIITAHWDDLYIDTAYRSDAGIYIATGSSTLGNYYLVRWATTYWVYPSSMTPADFGVLIFENGHILFSMWRVWSGASPNEYITRGDNTNYIDLTSRWRLAECVLFILVNPYMTVTVGSEQAS